MSELNQLISQQVTLLTKQNELLKKESEAQKTYIEKLEQRNKTLEALMTQPLPDVSQLLVEFSNQSEQFLRDKFLNVLKNLNLEAYASNLVSQQIEQQLQPLLTEIQQIDFNAILSNSDQLKQALTMFQTSQLELQRESEKMSTINSLIKKQTYY